MADVEKGTTYTDTYGYEWDVIDKEGLIEAVWNLEVGKGFDFAESYNGDIYATQYRAEAIEWSDTMVVLLGGHGSITMCESEGLGFPIGYRMIADFVHDFFNKAGIRHNGLIFKSR